MNKNPLTRCAWLGVAVLALGLAGCGRKAPVPRMTPLAQDAVILIYAGGVTEEGDLFRANQIDETFARVMKRKVVSLGQGGEFSEAALKRLPAALDGCAPDLVILGYGAMDLWKKTDRAQLKASLGAMIDLARKRNAQVVMLAMPDLNRLLPKPDPVFEEVAREKRVPIETAIVRAVLSDASTRVYRYMPNDDGIEKLAEAIRALCVKCGGLPE